MSKQEEEKDLPQVIIRTPGSRWVDRVTRDDAIAIGVGVGFSITVFLLAIFVALAG